MIFIIAIILLALLAELLRSNLYISVDEYLYMSNDLPAGFSGVKIVQISDYHNSGEGFCDRLLSKVKLESPDYIFITGDTADSICTDLKAAEGFLEKVSKIADCYLVWGNHDLALSLDDQKRLKDCCVNNGITVLENSYAVLERGSDKVLLVGTDQSMDSTQVERMFGSVPKGCKTVIWLHHYPEDFKDIVDVSEKAGIGADLVFSGHAHGGLIGIPFAEGLYAPGQGFFPEYASGRYEYGSSVMLVSRGVGNSGYTKRLFNSLHLVVCELKSGKK